MRGILHLTNSQLLTCLDQQKSIWTQISFFQKFTAILTCQSLCAYGHYSYFLYLFLTSSWTLCIIRVNKPGLLPSKSLSGNLHILLTKHTISRCICSIAFPSQTVASSVLIEIIQKTWYGAFKKSSKTIHRYHQRAQAIRMLTYISDFSIIYTTFYYQAWSNVFLNRSERTLINGISCYISHFLLNDYYWDWTINNYFYK